jgi:hypothetical protein
VTDKTSIEEQLRAELVRMRAEVRAERPAPNEVTTRVRRAMTVSFAAAALAVAVAVTGSVFAWRAFAPAGSEPRVPATQRTLTPSGSAVIGNLSDIEQELLSRPLALPTVSAGAPCPTSPITRISPGPGSGFTGSVRAQVAGGTYLWQGARVSLTGLSRTSGGWYAIKDIWIVDGSYEGPVLIRGGQANGEEPIELAWNPTTPMQDALLIDPGSPSLQTSSTTGSRTVPTETYVRGPGCYAYQLDGVGFTRFIVFEASA